MPAQASNQPLAVVRVAREADIDALFDLACRGGSGLTNLPPDRKALAGKLAASEAAIADVKAREGGAAVLLILEFNGRVAGTSCVFPRVGAEWPFYSYRLTRQAARSLAVGRSQAQILLNLVNDFDGEAEVGGLFIDPGLRGHALGALAARARYLFIAAHRPWFRDRVIAELRGWQDAQGRSPFWDAIGRHFYDMDFEDADRTGALNGNQFIADLGPRYPLYVSLLPEAAREAMGRPHDDGLPAYAMLIDEGFRAGDYVDIFDGGPTLVCDIDAVRTVRETRAVPVERIGREGEPMLIAAGEGPDFRVTRGTAKAESISEGAARALKVEPGMAVRMAPL